MLTLGTGKGGGQGGALCRALVVEEGCEESPRLAGRYDHLHDDVVDTIS